MSNQDIATMIETRLINEGLAFDNALYNVVNQERQGIQVNILRGPVVSIQWSRNHYADTSLDVPLFECAAWRSDRSSFINPYPENEYAGSHEVMSYQDLDTIVAWVKQLVR